MSAYDTAFCHYSEDVTVDEVREQLLIRLQERHAECWEAVCVSFGMEDWRRKNVYAAVLHAAQGRSDLYLENVDDMSAAVRVARLFGMLGSADDARAMRAMHTRDAAARLLAEARALTPETWREVWLRCHARERARCAPHLPSPALLYI